MLATAIVWGFISPLLADLIGLGEWFLRLDLLLVWLAFAIALVVWFRTPDLPVKLIVVSLVLLGITQLITASRVGIPLAGPALSFALYGVPFAVIATVVLARPGRDGARLLLWLLFGLAVLQFLISVGQIPFASHPDEIFGMFKGIMIAPHLNGAIAGAVALWILGRSAGWRDTLWAAPFILVTILSDTKQALFLLPFALALSPALNLRVWAVRLVLPVLGTLLALWSPAIPGVIPDNYGYAIGEIERSVETSPGDGRSRKLSGLEETTERVTESPGNLAFGLGQGQSVGYIALLSNKASDDSVSRSLGLEPSQIQAEEIGYWYGSGSFSSEFSSMVGLFGDLGLVGLLAFGIGIAGVVLLVLKTPGRDRNAVWALGLYYLAMGLIYIWWEQPVFTLFIGLLMGAIFASGGRSVAPWEWRPGKTTRPPD